MTPAEGRSDLYRLGSGRLADRRPAEATLLGSRLAAASKSSRPSLGISWAANAPPTPVGRAEQRRWAAPAPDGRHRRKRDRPRAVRSDRARARLALRRVGGVRLPAEGADLDLGRGRLLDHDAG